MLEMMSDAATNAGKHDSQTLIVRVANETQQIQLFIGPNDFVHYDVMNFPGNSPCFKSPISWR